MTRSERRYSGDTLILETDFETADGAVRVIDFMPPRERAPDIVRIVEGLRGRVPMRMELVIRFDYGSIVPWVRRLNGTLVAVGGPDGLALRTPVETRGQDLTTVAEFTIAENDRIPFALTWYPSHEPPPPEIDPEQALQDTYALVEGVVGPLHVRGRLERGRRPVAHRPQGAHVRADRRHRRGAHDLAPRSARRRAELGLPLLLAARRDVHALLARQRRLHGGGARVARLAPAGGGRRPGRPPDHVRRRGRAAPARVRAALAPRLRGVEAGPDRERGVEAAPARRLRRGHGHTASRAPRRARGRPELVVAPARAALVPRGRVEGARRGDLGGPRAAAALHALEGHGLGRVRPRGEGDRAFGPRRAARPLEAAARRDPRGGLPRGLRPGAERVRPVLRRARSSTRACS